MQMSTAKENLDYEPIAAFGPKKALSDVIADVVQDTMVLSTKQALPAAADYKDLSEDFNSQTYEDILATAVLNKVFEKCEISTHEFVGGAELAAEQGGTDTDSGLSGSLRGDVLKGVFRSASEGLSEESPSPPPCLSPKEDFPMTLAPKICGSPPTSLDSPCEDGGLEAHPPSRNSPDLWSPDEEDGAPVQFKIEEHIEEITTHHVTDEEILSDIEDEKDGGGEAPISGTDSYPSDAGRNGKPKSTLKKKRFATKMSSEAPQNLLPAFDLPSITGASILDPGRVPFPELGVDLLQESAVTEDSGPSDLVLENIDWKQNWLFKSGKGKRSGVKSVDTITMLIPNPSSVIGPTIGDRDIDELSELSDRHSNYSFDMTSSEEEQEVSSKYAPEPSKDLLELVGEISAEFAQQDHEYTEHTTGLDRLQMINSRNAANVDSLSFSNSGNIQEDIVTPVPKPRKISLSRNQDGKNSTLTKDKNTRKYETSTKNGLKCSPGFRTPVAILEPPQNVPQTFDNISSSSPTVWFESAPEDQVVPVGRALRVICQVQAKKICGVSWYYGNELLDSRKDVLKWKKADVHHLNVFEMSDAKAGTYIVGAYTKEDFVWSRFHVSCTDQMRVKKIPRITLTLSDVMAENGGDAILECQVGGHPEPKVTFIRNSAPLSPSGNCAIENDQYGTWILRLMGVTEEESGKLKAIASNSLGHAMTSCNIIVVPEGQLPKAHLPAAQKTQGPKNNKKKKKCSTQTENNASKETKSNSKSSNEREINNKEMIFQPSIINSSDVDQTFTCINNKINQNHNDVSDESVDGTYDIQGITINGHYFQPPKPGTIAEREHRKWLEAKPLPNNPYSPEKLVHRLGQRPNRFPSLPVVYRDSSAEEQLETRLRDGIMSSTADLSRYSRDYHVNSVQATSGRGYKSEDEVSKGQRRPQVGLVRIEPTVASDWKEELKDIKLNVGKKVADIQKTIDAYQHEWGVRLHQKGSNNHHFSQQRNRTNFKFNNQKLSASCINLTSPPNKTFTTGSKNRHLVYSSTEALNASNCHSEKSRSDIWRTVSVDTLNSPPKFSLMASTASSDQVNRTRFDSRESIDGHDHPQHGFIVTPISDSDESTGPYSQYHNTNSGYKSLHNNFSNQNGYRMMASHYSENSIDSLKEESDTEESYSTIEDNPNLPSVKELASKFDSLKSVKNRSATNRKSHHEKSLRPSRHKDVVIVEHKNQNGSIIPPYRSTPYHRKYNAKVPMNEVHHSLTARSVSRSFREGLRLHNQRRQPSKMETLPDEGSRFLNQDQESQAVQRDTSSPEHLGIPSSPASIQPRHHYSYPTPGDTSDDSMAAGLTPRKNYRKRNSTGRN